MNTQNEQERQELRNLIDEDRQHIINFLKIFKLKANRNQISILFSEKLERPDLRNFNSFEWIWLI